MTTHMKPAHFLRPQEAGPGSVDLFGMARPLAYEMRYRALTSQPYSVAEHLIRASYHVPSEWALPTFLHDGPEAWVKDLPRGFKRTKELAGYRDVEQKVADMLAGQHGFCGSLFGAKVVHDADDEQLALEVEAFFRPYGYEWEFFGLRGPAASPARRIAFVLAPNAAETLFAARWYELMKESHERMDSGWMAMGGDYMRAQCQRADLMARGAGYSCFPEYMRCMFAPLELGGEEKAAPWPGISQKEAN